MKMTETEARTRLAEGRLYDPGRRGFWKSSAAGWRFYTITTLPARRRRGAGRSFLGKCWRRRERTAEIEPPFHANFGGGHVHFGNNVYANFNLTVVDDAHVYVGDDVQIGPNVTIATAGASAGSCVSQDGDAVCRGHSHRRRRLDRGRERSSSRRFRRSRFGDRRGQRGGTRDIPAGARRRPEIPAGCSGRSGRGDREYYYKDRRVDVVEEQRGREISPTPRLRNPALSCIV